MTYIATAKPSGRVRNRPLKDYSGQVFGRLTAIKLVNRDPRWNNHLWLFRCECGNEKLAGIKLVSSGHTSSCGCLFTDKMRARNTTHGLSSSPIYKTWKDMRSRCSNPNRADYKDYGGRGIAICDRWADFSVFASDMGDRPEGHTLDRIDVNGNYCPENCRWALPKVQSNNKRTNHLVTIDGVARTLQEWCDQFGIEPSKVRWRLSQGWDVARAFSKDDNRKL